MGKTLLVAAEVIETLYPIQEDGLLCAAAEPEKRVYQPILHERP